MIIRALLEMVDSPILFGAIELFLGHGDFARRLFRAFPKMGSPVLTTCHLIEQVGS